MSARWYGELKPLVRLTRDLPSFLRIPITLEQAAAQVRHRLQRREQRFLYIAEKAIYSNRRSPYLRLLRSVGCELEDLRRMVATGGLEDTLRRLVQLGVYVTFDEFKGTREVIRGSERFWFADADFDNPLAAPHFVLWTGGTRNPAISVKVSLSFVADMAMNTAVGLDAHDLTEYDHAYWLYSYAVAFALRVAKLGRLPRAWFYPLEHMPLKGVAGARYLTLISRLAKRPLPAPRFLDLREPERIVSWLQRQLAAAAKICLTCNASAAVRVAAAADEAGIPLDGVCFITLGEALTAAKRRVVSASGARAVNHYGSTETGLIGYSCTNPKTSDDVHLFDDAHALVQRCRSVDATGTSVQAVLLSSLLASAPKVMLNVELGDYAVVEQRTCGCEMEALGLRTHIMGIRSYEKLSGEGMTFVATDLLEILEQVLPGRFGGTLSDYQLIEEENHKGVDSLVLAVSPRVGAIDESAVRSCFLQELVKNGGPSKIGGETWSRLGTVRIARRVPVATPAGKVLPFHFLKP